MCYTSANVVQIARPHSSLRSPKSRVQGWHASLPMTVVDTVPSDGEGPGFESRRSLLFFLALYEFSLFAFLGASWVRSLFIHCSSLITWGIILIHYISIDAYQLRGLQLLNYD